MKRLRQKGQTSLEYMLMLAVSISLGMVFMKKMSTYFLENPNSFLVKSLNQYKIILGKPEDRYKTFRVLK